MSSLIIKQTLPLMRKVDTRNNDHDGCKPEKPAKVLTTRSSIHSFHSGPSRIKINKFIYPCPLCTMWSYNIPRRYDANTGKLYWPRKKYSKVEHHPLPSSSASSQIENELVYLILLNTFFLVETRRKKLSLCLFLLSFLFLFFSFARTMVMSE